MQKKHLSVFLNGIRSGTDTSTGCEALWSIVPSIRCNGPHRKTVPSLFQNRRCSSIFYQRSRSLSILSMTTSPRTTSSSVSWMSSFRTPGTAYSSSLISLMCGPPTSSSSLVSSISRITGRPAAHRSSSNSKSMSARSGCDSTEFHPERDRFGAAVSLNADPYTTRYGHPVCCCCQRSFRVTR